MPRRARPNLDVIVRVPRYEPYTEKRDRRGSTTTIAVPPTSTTTSTTTAETPTASASTTSSAEWNSLLIWARRTRGPQWDSGVGIWMVDQGGEEFYRFCNDPTQSVHVSLSSADPPVGLQRPIGGIGVGNTPDVGTPDGMQSAPVSATNGHGLNSASGRGFQPGFGQQQHPLANEVGTVDYAQQQSQSQMSYSSG